jgi:hypothetical protein
MGIRVRATGIAIGVLLVVMLGQPAKADSYHVSGQTDFAACASIGQVCSDVSYSLDFTTGPPVLDPNHPGIDNVWLFVSAISGEINSIPISSCKQLSVGTCNDLLVSRFNYAGPPIPDGFFYLSGGIPANFSGGPDAGFFPFSSTIRFVVGNQSPAYTTWNIVNTPEPSTLLSLGIGMLGLMALTLLRSRSS